MVCKMARPQSKSPTPAFTLRVAQGDLPGPPAAFAEGLEICLRLARDFPAVVEYRLALVVSQTKMARVTAEPVRWLLGALLNLERLQAEGLLPPNRRGWIGWAQDELARHGWRPHAAE